MPEYVIEREVPGAGNLTEDEIREVSLRSLAVLKELGSSIQWLHSYVTTRRFIACTSRMMKRRFASMRGAPACRPTGFRRCGGF
jgi:hypothetical protein